MLCRANGKCGGQEWGVLLKSKKASRDKRIEQGGLYTRLGHLGRWPPLSVSIQLNMVIAMEPKKVQQPATTKASAQEVRADGRWFICCCWPSGRWGMHVSKPISWKTGDLCHKARLCLSVEVDVFKRKERGTEQREHGRGLQSSLCAD